jgi:hypothetical protein
VKGQTPILLGHLERANLKPPSLEDGTDPVSETCYLLFRILDVEQNPKTQYF